MRNLEDRWGGWERLWERVEARSSDENEGHLTGRRGTLRGHARLLRWTGRGVCRDEEGQRLLEGQGVNSESRVGCPGWGRAPLSWGWLETERHAGLVLRSSFIECVWEHLSV